MFRYNQLTNVHGLNCSDLVVKNTLIVSSVLTSTGDNRPDAGSEAARQGVALLAFCCLKTRKR